MIKRIDDEYLGPLELDTHNGQEQEINFQMHRFSNKQQTHQFQRPRQSLNLSHKRANPASYLQSVDRPLIKRALLEKQNTSSETAEEH